MMLPFMGGLTASAAPTKADDTITGNVTDDLIRYIGFGSKQAGGPGDKACGDWMAGELVKAGFEIERQSVSVPSFAPARTELVSGDAKANVWPQPIVMPTSAEGISARIVRVDAAGRASAPLDGAIALIDLPHGRWSSALSKAIWAPTKAAFAAGAVAAVIITNGPSGKVIALNTDGRKPMFAGPTALIAPEDAAPFLAAAMAGETATLYLTGESSRRPAFNFVGRIDRGKGRWLIVSTPRSGWFTCAGERGGGVAAWLAIARWAAAAVTSHNLAFVCNSGHEYEYLGAEESMKAMAPKPAETDFWLHLGANLAARDWHEITGAPMPLPGTDAQRYLVTSPALLPAARELFAGLSGLEAPYSSQDLSAGELTGIIAAGYPSVAGIFGIHRFHHVAEDDARCVVAAAVAETTTAFQRLLVAALKI
ncbi:hypothetical protein [Gimibacter soli]|uniref:PA domain-containing protein n=1 Tax=Gimibacter soli TaxID=3024400 RepID=A0AAE9XQA8_9PROT|nr:hypothetical protein [Gimibacter soli]WCL55227.1 hypothetical protein PH603_05585 [Gimibacter soli]